jgi:DNA-binding response OmpR family regulator
MRRQQEPQEQAYVYMVLLTSKESKEDIVTGLESGADDYLTKPFHVDELKTRCEPASAFCTWKAGSWKRAR